MKSKNLLFITLVCLGLLSQACSAQKLNLKGITDQVNNTISGKPSLSNDDIVKGLKEALTIGGDNASSLASKVDGYYKNPSIIIPFPPEARDMEQKLRKIGMSEQVDEFVMTLNRAAEEAAKEAAPIFKAAVRNMTITDGINILKGSDDAATVYLKNTTSSQLVEKFKPVIQAALLKVEITKYWKPLMTRYNRIPFVRKMNPNLEDYVTQKAIQGMFFLIAQEELKIRKDPVARVTDILKKVFGS